MSSRPTLDDSKRLYVYKVLASYTKCCCPHIRLWHQYLDCCQVDREEQARHLNRQIVPLTVCASQTPIMVNDCQVQLQNRTKRKESSRCAPFEPILLALSDRHARWRCTRCGLHAASFPRNMLHTDQSCCRRCICIECRAVSK